jgi:exonuclease III
VHTYHSNFLKNFSQTSSQISKLETWVRKWQLATITEVSLLIAGIEPNPGPTPNTTTNLEVITYNVRGLGNRNKVNKLFNELNNIHKKSPYLIAFLQETHVASSDFLTFKWRPDKVFQPGSGSSMGVAAIFGSGWRLLEDEAVVSDPRMILAVTEARTDASLKMITGCIYAPNDKNVTTISFYENFFNHLEEKMHKYPDAKVVIAGDFNIPLYEDECSMRIFTKWEKIMAKGILDNMQTLGLQDSYRNATTKVGSEHTFKRPGAGIYSVIDRIITNFMPHDTTSSSRTWGLIPSDHAMLTSNFNLSSEARKGPGLFKLNVRTLENDMSIEQIKKEFEEMLEGIPGTWTPHEKLDFAKASFSGIVTKLDRKTKIETTTLGEQLKKDLTYAHRKLEMHD